MAQSEWSYETTGTIKATVERVVAWWMHADRSKELREQFEQFAAGDVSVEKSASDGVRVSDYRWKTRQGEDQHHHVEAILTPGDTPARVDDRFVIPVSDSFTFQLPSGKRATRACNGQIEFIPHGSEVTEVRVAHHHRLEGGNRIEQWSHRRAEQRSSVRSFQKMTSECQEAMG